MPAHRDAKFRVLSAPDVPPMSVCDAILLEPECDIVMNPVDMSVTVVVRRSWGRYGRAEVIDSM